MERGGVLFWVGGDWLQLAHQQSCNNNALGVVSPHWQVAKAVEMMVMDALASVAGELGIAGAVAAAACWPREHLVGCWEGASQAGAGEPLCTRW